jgi:hypothetical protein
MIATIARAGFSACPDLPVLICRGLPAEVGRYGTLRTKHATGWSTFRGISIGSPVCDV